MTGSEGPIRRVAVVIPACDEEERVGRCLASVAAAIMKLHVFAAPEATDDSAPPLGAEGMTVTVVLAADACTDRTVEVARQAWAEAGLPPGRAMLEVLEGRWRSAGGARAAAAGHAVGVEPRPEWLASTDADTAVPPNWLEYQLDRAAEGVDAVLGTVEPDPQECPEPVYRLWQREHTLAEGHPHIHAANMGVRVSAYERAGGFPAVECSEDEALVGSLRELGARIEATDRIRAITSGRLEGRAELGFAHHLQSLAQLAGTPAGPASPTGPAQRFADRRNACATTPAAGYGDEESNV